MRGPARGPAPGANAPAQFEFVIKEVQWLSNIPLKLPEAKILLPEKLGDVLRTDSAAKKVSTLKDRSGPISDAETKMGWFFKQPIEVRYGDNRSIPLAITAKTEKNKSYVGVRFLIPQGAHNSSTMGLRMGSRCCLTRADGAEAQVPSFTLSIEQPRAEAATAESAASGAGSGLLGRPALPLLFC